MEDGLIRSRVPESGLPCNEALRHAAHAIRPMLTHRVLTAARPGQRPMPPTGMAEDR